MFDRLRRGILAGTLPPGSRLPPTRHLAEELSVARQTVVLAYERLAAEGYVRARIGSGTFVATDLPDATPPPAAPPSPAVAVLSRRGVALAATPAVAGGRAAGGSALLAPGIPAPDLFPAAAWASCSARVLRALTPDQTGYPDPQGLPELRTAIAAHLAATRGLLADAEHIVVTAGTLQALRIAADLLLDPGDPAWVEEPGYIAGRGALLAAGAVLVPVPSDAEGLDVAAGIALAPRARLALVAPSHATPLGGALPIGRRLALLDWAARADAWLLEDDCDAEFRWEGKPLPPLASLDAAGRVIYCGTFSKTLAPALRLDLPSYAALDRRLRAGTNPDGPRPRHAEPGGAGGVHAPGPVGHAYPPHTHGICKATGGTTGGAGVVLPGDHADRGARRAASCRAATGRRRRGRGAACGAGTRIGGIAAGRLFQRHAAPARAGDGICHHADRARRRDRAAVGGGGQSGWGWVNHSIGIWTSERGRDNLAYV